MALQDGAQPFHLQPDRLIDVFLVDLPSFDLAYFFIPLQFKGKMYILVYFNI